MTTPLQLHSVDDQGTVRTIAIAKTDGDKAHIEIKSSAAPGSTQSYDVKNVKADAATLTMVCQVDAFFSADISVAVQREAGGQVPVATVIVSHAILGDGTYVYPLRAGDDRSMEAFLQGAAFPPLAAGDA